MFILRGFSWPMTLFSKQLKNAASIYNSKFKEMNVKTHIEILKNWFLNKQANKTDLRPEEHVIRAVTNQRLDFFLSTNQVYCDLAHALISRVGISQLQFFLKFHWYLECFGNFVFMYGLILMIRSQVCKVSAQYLTKYHIYSASKNIM